MKTSASAHYDIYVSRYYTKVLREQVVKVAKASGAKVYLATISVIGEEVNNTNHDEIKTCTRPALLSGG